jgi:hypothetical protein
MAFHIFLFLLVICLLLTLALVLATWHIRSKKSRFLRTDMPSGQHRV